ncbi:MAG: leucine-rich repeat protein [Bacteroidaceae bacterium]|nr:leucine-rich repeat protein [Bacteroidaceae bacterium]
MTVTFKIIKYMIRIYAYILFALLGHVDIIAADCVVLDKWLRYTLTIDSVSRDGMKDTIVIVDYNNTYEWDGIYSDGINELVIPGTISINNKVYHTRIGRKAFADCKFFHDVRLADGVDRIDGYAFYGCSNMHSIYIPASTTVVAPSALRNCEALNIISVSKSNPVYGSCSGSNALVENGILQNGCGSTIIPEGKVVEIAHQAFMGCKALKSIIIPEGVRRIASEAFRGCSNLSDVILPQSLTEMSGQVFGHCTRLESLTIPKNVKLIVSNPVTWCPSIKYLHVEKGNAKYHSNNQNDAIIETAKHSMIAACKTVTINRDIQRLDALCLAGQPIVNVFIPKWVKHISSNALAYCPIIATIEVDKRNPYYDSRHECNAIIDTTKDILIAGCYNTSIPNDVTIIGMYAFAGRTLPESFDIPASIKLIEYDAFRMVNGLKHIKWGISKGNVHIEDKAFEDCPDLNL